MRIGGTVEGYAYGSVLPAARSTFMVLKGNLDFRFVWRALLRELAALLRRQGDLPQPGRGSRPAGLRENKLSYQPCALMEKYQGRLL